MRNQKTKTLVECAILVAVGLVLSQIKFAPWPQGGSITLCSMAPIVLLSLRHGWKWGLLSALTFSLLQMLIEGISTPPVTTLGWYIAVVLLDYVVAFTVLGLAGALLKGLPKKAWAPAVASCCVTLLRYLCHIVSGMAIWGVYATIQPVWLYSTVYNGSYMIPETIMTAIVVTLLYTTLQKRVKA